MSWQDTSALVVQQKGYLVLRENEDSPTQVTWMDWRVARASSALNERKRREYPLKRLKEIGLKEGMTFADIGCAVGFYAFIASSLVGKSGFVYALDINSNMVAHVLDKAKREGIHNVKALVADAQDTGLPSESVDIAFLNAVLHGVKDKPKAFNEFNRILKRNGRLVINEEDLMPLATIRELAKEAGFRRSKSLRKTIQIFERVAE